VRNVTKANKEREEKKEKKRKEKKKNKYRASHPRVYAVPGFR